MSHGTTTDATLTDAEISTFESYCKHDQDEIERLACRMKPETRAKYLETSSGQLGLRVCRDLRTARAELARVTVLHEALQPLLEETQRMIHGAELDTFHLRRVLDRVTAALAQASERAATDARPICIACPATLTEADLTEHYDVCANCREVLDARDLMRIRRENAEHAAGSGEGE